MKNSENADRPMSAIAQRHFSFGPCRRSGRPAQTSRKSEMRLSSALTLLSNHAPSPNTSKICSILRRHQTSNKTYYMWQTRLTRPSPSDPAHARCEATLECDSSALRTAGDGYHGFPESPDDLYYRNFMEYLYVAVKARIRLASVQIAYLKALVTELRQRNIEVIVYFGAIHPFLQYSGEFDRPEGGPNRADMYDELKRQVATS
jgi:hypothetical protein